MLRKIYTTRRQHQKLKEKLTQVSQITPEKEARCSLSDVGLSPEDVPSLHRDLVALHSVAKEIKVAHDEHVRKLHKSRVKPLEKVKRKRQAQLTLHEILALSVSVKVLKYKGPTLH